ncbi:MAG: O-antigen ligase family protein, partial [Candidatus Margulisbacteria bacterium]|nr:O-antigen ligase family protein [Candidatus Margulisiibacteriota bacterium]
WGGVITWQRVIGTIGQPNFLAAYMLMAFFMILYLILLDKKDILPESEWYEQLYPIGYFVFCQIGFLVMIYTLEAFNVLLWYFGFTAVTAAALLFAFYYDRLHPKVLNLVLGACLLLIYISILFTQSRGGYMGLFAGIVVFCLVAGRHWLLMHWRKMLILASLIILVSGVTMTRSEFSPFERFTKEITTEQVEETEKENAVESKTESKLELKGAAGSRGETWKSAFSIIADNPFFGIGPEVLKMVFPRYETELFRFKEAFHVKQDRCHNETFDVGVTKGLITFFAYLWLLFVFFRVGWLKANRGSDNERLMLAGLLAAAVAFLIQNQFSFGVVAITSLFWVIWAMVMVVGEKDGQGESKKFSWLEAPWFAIALIGLLVAFLVYVSFLSFRGDVWFKSGKNEMQVARFAEAAADFDRSLNVFPFEGGTVSHKGIAHLNLSNQKPEQRRDQINLAIAALRYGTQIDAYNADNFYLLAKIYLMLNDLAEAGDLADKALKIDPYYAEVYHTRGMIHERLGKNAEAAWHYEKAFMINPGLTQPLQDLERLNRRLGKDSETLKALERGLKRYEGHLLFLERTASYYLMQGREDQALAFASKMIKQSPKSANGYLIRASVYQRQGKIAQAYSDLQQVIINDPKNVVAHNELGRVYLIRGERGRARDEFEQVQRLDPNNDFAKKMLDRLK